MRRSFDGGMLLSFFCFRGLCLVLGTLLWSWFVWGVFPAWFSHFSQSTGLTAAINRGEGLALPISQMLFTASQVLLLLIGAWLARRNVREFLGWRRPDVGNVALGIGAIVIVQSLFVAGLLLLVVPLSGKPELSPGAELVKSLGSWSLPSLLAFLVLPAVLAPVWEETFLRGFLWSGLQPVFGHVATLMIVSILFAAVHAPVYYTVADLFSGGLSDPPSQRIWRLMIALRITTDGLIFGWLRWRTGGTTAGMAAHSTANLTATGVVFAFSGAL